MLSEPLLPVCVVLILFTNLSHFKGPNNGHSFFIRPKWKSLRIHRHWDVDLFVDNFNTLYVTESTLATTLSIWCDDLDGQRLVCLANIKILQTDTQYFILINFCVLWSQQSLALSILYITFW